MNVRFAQACRAALCLLLFVATATTSLAAPPWMALVPFRRNVEADPKKTYELTQGQGPWMIMCTSFSGENAEEQAHQLCLEIRSRFQLEAFVFKQNFDFTKSEIGLGLNQFGGPKKMRYANGAKIEEVAVLVGNFGSVEDPAVEKVLEQIKYAKPEMFAKANPETSGQTFAQLRNVYRLVSKSAEKKQRGPLGNAFVTRNPLLPEEMFVSKGIDPFVVEMNEGRAHSLLGCPGAYTVKVATFRGVDTMKPAEFEKLISKRKSSKLDEAAEKATKLCESLRRRQVEAYVFHDITESYVCVGSFDTVGTPLPSGNIEINPAIYKVIQSYGPEKKAIPGQMQTALEPRMLDNLPFDVQPMPVEVPKRSIAAAYSRSLLEQ